MQQIINFFIDSYRQAPSYLIALEGIAFVFGIVSVYYAKKANIWVYPTGLVCTLITVYLLNVNEYYGDMTMNVYYSAMSIYGWWNWARRKENKPVVPIASANKREKWIGFFFFLITMLVTYLVYVAYQYSMELPNYIDIFTSGVFFTAMWFMANKKLESWVLWILGDVITIPLYAYRGMGMLSLQYLIFLILAIQGYLVWKKNLDNSHQTV